MPYVIFIKMDGIEGESTDARHKDEIDVLSWSWGVTLPSSAHAGGAGGAGKPIPADLKFTHRIDVSSPSLIRACASGRRLKEAVVSVQKAGADPRATPDPFLTIKLNDVLVKSVVAGHADPVGCWVRNTLECELNRGFEAECCNVHSTGPNAA